MQSNQSQRPMDLPIQRHTPKRLVSIQVGRIQRGELHHTLRRRGAIVGSLEACIADFGRNRGMTKDEDVGGSFEGEGSLWVLFYEELDETRHDDNLRMPHSNGSQGLGTVQIRMLLGSIRFREGTIERALDYFEVPDRAQKDSLLSRSYLSRALCEWAHMLNTVIQFSKS
jgi:hypothetical protein